jgi:hypothetical protein
LRSSGSTVLQRGHETLSGLIPHLFLTSVPYITNANPIADTAKMTIRTVILHRPDAAVLSGSDFNLLQ